ncbi:MAG: TonB-dependent receptor, partial [Proteobacteria bacterium]
MGVEGRPVVGDQRPAARSRHAVARRPVIQPAFVTGFQASVDWWKIDISDAITQLTSQQLVDRCVAGDASLCQYVIRAANNDIVQIDSLFINLNNQKIEGYDIEVGYRRGMEIFGGGAESVGLRLFGTRLMHNITQAPGGTPDEQVGQINLGLPKWKATAVLQYANGPVSGSVIGRYVGSGILDRTLVESPVAIAGVTTIDNNSVGSAFYTDLSLNFRPQALEGLRV